MIINRQHAFHASISMDFDGRKVPKTVAYEPWGLQPPPQYLLRRRPEYFSTNPVILGLKNSISIENKTKCIFANTQTQAYVGKIPINERGIDGPENTISTICRLQIRQKYFDWRQL